MKYRDDEELAQRCRAALDDGQAWSELKRRFHPLIRFKVATFALPSGFMDVEDYVSEVWLKLVREIKQYSRSRGRFRPFLMTMTHNVVLDSIRAHTLERQYITQPPDDLDRPEPIVHTALTADLNLDTVVDEVDRHITDDRKRLIFGRLQAGTRMADIARETGFDPSFVRRARKELERLTREVLDEVLPPRQKNLRPR